MAVLLQIGTRYNESINDLKMRDHYWTQYTVFHTQSQSVGVQLSMTIKIKYSYFFVIK